MRRTFQHLAVLINTLHRDANRRIQMGDAGLPDDSTKPASTAVYDNSGRPVNAKSGASQRRTAAHGQHVERIAERLRTFSGEEREMLTGIVEELANMEHDRREAVLRVLRKMAKR